MCSFFQPKLVTFYWIHKYVVQKSYRWKIVTVINDRCDKAHVFKCRRSLGRLLKDWRPIEVQPQLQTFGTDVRVRQYHIVLDGKNWSTNPVSSFENHFSIWVDFVCWASDWDIPFNKMVGTVSSWENNTRWAG